MPKLALRPAAVRAPGLRARAMRRRIVLGFALLEALIGIFIFALGILKFVQLDLKSHRAAHDNLLQTHASLLAADMFDRLSGNYSIAINGGYNIANSSSATSDKNCASTPCTPEQLKSWDIHTWHTQLSRQLPAGTGKISSSLSGSVRLYQIEIQYKNRRGDVSSLLLTSGL
jgi:type IV pilus modification protein PilV